MRVGGACSWFMRLLLVWEHRGSVHAPPASAPSLCLGGVLGALALPEVVDSLAAPVQLMLVGLGKEPCGTGAGSDFAEL